MTRWIARLFTVIAVLGASPSVAQVINFAENDAEMNAAITAARDKLPWFLGKTAAMPAEAWFLKAALPTKRDDFPQEHIWMALCEPVGSEEFSCVVSNQPEYAPLEPGQRIVFGSDIVTDWMYLDRAGKIHGAYTTRVMLSRLPAGEAGGLAEQLAPLEAD